MKAIEKGIVEDHKESIQLMASIFPHELAQWLLKKQTIEVIPKILMARFVQDANEKELYLVPGKEQEKDPAKKREEEILKEIGKMMEEDLLNYLKKNSKTKDIKVKAIPMDRNEIRRQVILKGGCPIQLASLIESSGESYPATIGVALPGPEEDGFNTPNYISDRLGWQIESYENLFIERGLMPESDNPHNYLPFFFSLYLWPGTGLYDEEEFFIMNPRLDLESELFLSPDPTIEEMNREKDKKILELRKMKDRRRRESWERRKRLFHDPMISLEELERLYKRFDPEKETVKISITYDAIRLWEIPVEELLQELPTGCLGLALFGHKPLGMTIKDMVLQAFLTLRYRILDQGLEGESALKATLSLCSIAGNWLDPVALMELTSRSGLDS